MTDGGWGVRKCGNDWMCGNGFLEVWQGKGLATDFADLWQRKDLGGAENGKVKMEIGKDTCRGWGKGGRCSGRLGG